MSKTKTETKQNHLKSWCEQNETYLAAFFIPVITMLIIFAGNEIFPFGDQSFLHIDMYHQYFPFLTEFFHKLRSGDSLLYSWNTGIGTNFVALYAYYLASPFNWLCILCPEKYLMEFMTYLIVIKIGLSSLSLSYYLSKHFHTKTIGTAFFGCFYAMSGYMAAYNWNVMWLDCIVLAPIIILGLEALAMEGKYKLYCISLGLAILSNYYLCIMICIYLVLYFLLVLLPSAPKKGKAILDFTIYSLLAGGLAAVLLVPEVCALMLSKFSASTFPTTLKTYFSIFDVLARHCVDVAVETGLDHWPNIYCSVAVMFLFPLYVSNKTIKTKEKLGKIVLLSFMLISFSSNVLTFLWHGFNYPDSLPSRQSFLYILLLLTICFEAFLHMKETSKAELSRVFLGVIIFLILCQKLVTDDAFTDRTYLLSACFLIIYALILHKFRDYDKTPTALVFITSLIIVLESGSNMLLTSVPTVSRSGYLENYETYHTLKTRQSAKDQGSFYRYEKDNRVTNNDAMLQDYPSASLFSSTENSLVNGFYDQYGMKNSKVFYSFEGATPLTSALLSVKYNYSLEEKNEDSLDHLVDQEGNVYLYENNYTLPLGFLLYNGDVPEDELIDGGEDAFDVIDGTLDEESTKTTSLDEELLNPVEKQNLLVNRLGVYGTLFSWVDASEEGNSADIKAPVDGHYYIYCDSKKFTELNAYSDEGQLTFKKMKNKRIVDLGFHEAGDTIIVTANEDTTLNLSAYVMNEDVLSKVINRLGKSTLTIDRLQSTRLSGTIEAKTDGHLILSIPYDPGFTVLVDGQKVEAQLFEEMMMSIPVTAGTHTITLKYFPQGLLPGALITLMCIVILTIRINLGRIMALKNKNKKTS